MKIRRALEIPSTIIVKSLGSGRRRYWTGSEWVKDFFQAKAYRRKEARVRSKRMSGQTFVITIGFRGD